MLVPLQEKDFDKYIDFAYELALDPARTFYHVYFDGIKTKADFIAKARRTFTRPTEEILLYQEDGEVEGWLYYFYLPEDRYLQLASSCGGTWPRHWRSFPAIWRSGIPAVTGS